jgi:hypothetical protein
MQTSPLKPLYLKKSKAVTVRARLDDLEQRLNKLALLVTQ